jgi:hypothetical protein
LEITIIGRLISGFEDSQPTAKKVLGLTLAYLTIFIALPPLLPA